jgi:hypothetical protein
MEQEKLAELVRLIMADKRIMDLIKNGEKECGDLILVETKDIFEALPLEWRGNVCCQEFPDGCEVFLSFEAAAQRDWRRIVIYQPSLNVIAKLAMGIADEPLPRTVQQKLVEGAQNIELFRLCSLSGIKVESYKKLFLGHLDRIRSYGIKVADDGTGAAKESAAAEGKNREACVAAAGVIDWQYKALTERDLLDVEKGSVVTVGKKCIVTSLAVDMARRKAIQICREGEVR